MNSKYGVAYADGTEKITQLNRPAEKQSHETNRISNEYAIWPVGITESIMDGTADSKTMSNYHTRTIEPIVSAMVDEMKRKFLTKEARDKLETLLFFRDPFSNTPIEDLAEMADKFTRNEILSSNEFRQIIGFKPSKDPRADQLQNSNIKQPGGEEQKEETTKTTRRKKSKWRNLILVAGPLGTISNVPTVVIMKDAFIHNDGRKVPLVEPSTQRSK